MAHFLFWGPAYAQPGAAPDSMGGIDLTGLVVFHRDLDNNYPVQQGGQLYVSNKFGPVRITTWDNPLVNLKARIRVGAENMIQAERFAQAITVEGNQVDNRIELRTVYPQPDDDAAVGYTVDFTLSVPTDLNVSVENRFGDISVVGLSGDVAIDSSYGAIQLVSIGGRAQVRAKGDFPLDVRGLPKGGTFFLRSTPSTFSDIGGVTTISNYLGTIDVTSLHESCELSATCDNGPIRVVLPEGANPDLKAAAEFGDVESDIPVARQRWGKKTLVTSEVPNAQQRVDLKTSFGSIYIQTKALEPPPAFVPQSNAESVQEVITEQFPITAEQTLVIDAMPGDITLVASEEASVIEVEATRFVRVADAKSAPQALASLTRDVTTSETEMRVQTDVDGDIGGLGVTDTRIHLRIQHPKSTPIRLTHTSGTTTVQGAAGPVSIEQESGDIFVHGTAGELNVRLDSGSISLRETAGTVDASTGEGDIRTVGTTGSLTLEAMRGKTVIEDPRAGVVARNTQGDIRIVALEGVFGDFEIQTQNGNINMVIPPTSNALLLLNTQGGTVYSSFPVTGSLEKGNRTYQGRLNDATHRVVLEANQGNIVLD